MGAVLVGMLVVVVSVAEVVGTLDVTGVVEAAGVLVVMVVTVLPAVSASFTEISYLLLATTQSVPFKTDVPIRHQKRRTIDLRHVPQHYTTK